MYYNDNIWFGSTVDNYEKQYLNLAMANRHGLIAGATGTGKTTTLKVLAESFSHAGVSVFTADIKGDLSATCEAGLDNDDMQERIRRFKLAEAGFKYQGFPLEYWDVFEKQGHPIRASISSLGPILLSNIMNLTEAQTGILNIVFHFADDNKLLLDDIKDLKAVLQYVADNANELSTKYGYITRQSTGAIVRSLVELENMGAEKFFGNPELDINDWLQTDQNGKGTINLLECSELFQRPKLYSTFMLWMLSNLYETLAEVGDLVKPKIVFFFDEAHLLFADAPKTLVDKIIQTVRLIRSKGVGVFFVTQAPSDLPAEVLAQLGNRIQHALHAYTPKEQAKLKANCDTFRQNPEINLLEAIQELGKGEALVSCLDENGVPTIVQRCYILPPESRFGPLEDSVLQQMIKQSRFDIKYAASEDRTSAYEDIQVINENIEKQKLEEEEKEKQLKEEEKKRNKVQRELDRMLRSMGRTAINTITRDITRNFLGLWKRK